MTSYNNNLSQSRLKELLHYDPDTGVFTNLTNRSANCRVGDIAGYLNSKGYIYITIDSVMYKAHRLAFLYMTGEWPVNQVDHDNRIKNDNRWKNLNQATNTTNQRNQSMYNNNTSGMCGVHWHKASSKWSVRINSNGKRKHLGYFVTYFAAVYARHAAEIIYGYHPNHGSNRPL